MSSKASVAEQSPHNTSQHFSLLSQADSVQWGEKTLKRTPLFILKYVERILDHKACLVSS